MMRFLLLSFVLICHSYEISAGCYCTEEYQPFCGEDGVTYGNKCKLQCAGAQVKFEGVCAVRYVHDEPKKNEYYKKPAPPPPPPPKYYPPPPPPKYVPPPTPPKYIPPPPKYNPPPPPPKYIPPPPKYNPPPPKYAPPPPQQKYYGYGK